MSDPPPPSRWPYGTPGDFTSSQFPQNAGRLPAQEDIVTTTGPQHLILCLGRSRRLEGALCRPGGPVAHWGTSPALSFLKTLEVAGDTGGHCHHHQGLTPHPSPRTSRRLEGALHCLGGLLAHRGTSPAPSAGGSCQHRRTLPPQPGADTSSFAKDGLGDFAPSTFLKWL